MFQTSLFVFFIGEDGKIEIQDYKVAAFIIYLCCLAVALCSSNASFRAREEW